MHKETILKLNQINRNFYDQTAEHFDKTRNYSWAGWEEVVNTIKNSKLKIKNVLDLGCGNGRFFKFISEEFPNIKYLGVDQDQKLLKIARKSFRGILNLEFRSWNLLSQDDVIFKQKYDLIVIFGVMHHIPGIDNRKALLERAYKALSPSGVLVASFWDFMSDEKYRKRLVPWNRVDIKQSEIEENDYLLDWQKGVNALRYCHYNSEAEILEYIKLFGSKKVVRFEADGKNEKLNKYIVILNS